LKAEWELSSFKAEHLKEDPLSQGFLPSPTLGSLLRHPPSRRVEEENFLEQSRSICPPPSSECRQCRDSSPRHRSRKSCPPSSSSGTNHIRTDRVRSPFPLFQENGKAFPTLLSPVFPRRLPIFLTSRIELSFDTALFFQARVSFFPFSRATCACAFSPQAVEERQRRFAFR